MCNVYLIHSHKRIRHAQNNLFLFLYSFFFFVCSNITIAMNVLNGTFQQSWKQMILHSFGCFFVCFFNLAQILLKSIPRFWFFFFQQSVFIHFTFQCRPIFAPEKKINQIQLLKSYFCLGVEIVSGQFHFYTEWTFQS